MEETNPQISKKEQYEINQQVKRAQKKQTQRKPGLPGWVWGVGIILLAIALLVKLVTSGSSSVSSYDPLVSQSGDYIKGEATASATLVEFADFQCPACAIYSQLIEQLVKDEPGKVKVIFRNFPLKEIHSNAVASSIAAEAAGKQGKFWEMYSILYDKQSEWESLKDPKPTFIGYAGQMGINVDQFKDDMNAKEVIEKVNRDRESAIGLGLDSTPTFYINGKKVNNPRTLEDFKQLLKENN